MLDVALDLKPVDVEIVAIQKRALFLSEPLIALMSLFIFLFTCLYVKKTIQKLIEGTRVVSEMWLD